MPAMQMSWGMIMSAIMKSFNVSQSSILSCKLAVMQWFDSSVINSYQLRYSTGSNLQFNLCHHMIYGVTITYPLIGGFLGDNTYDALLSQCLFIVYKYKYINTLGPTHYNAPFK